MGRIPDETIERIRDTADLLEIVQESIQLKRQGSDWRGPCPFHNGSGRNFAVIPKKNLYYCFVCHAAGDVFTWYRERFGMDYPSAVREVARRYGIPVPEENARTGPDPNEALYQACDAAQGWFATQLRDLAEAEPARKYLLGRQFSLDAAAELGMGYAPRQGGDFLAAMRQLGIGDEPLLGAALVMRRDDGTLAPRFRGRLLFPIHDLRGRTVGFGGRIIGQGEPKYLNSPETEIFHKGSQLYHIHLAKNAIRKAEFAILVEGYFDVQRLVLAGMDHVVAPLGTALTEEQAKLLKRYSAEVVVLYDSDAAGLKATFKAADTLLAQGVRVRVATMPEGEDPDTLVQRGGAAALEPILHDAVDVLERKLQFLERGGWFTDVRKARKALDGLLPTIRAASDPVTKELYISRVAERMAIPRETVATEAANVRAPRPMAPPPSSASAPPEWNEGPFREETPRRGARIRRDSPFYHASARVEQRLLRLLIGHAEWRLRAADELAPDQFAVPAFRRIYEGLVALPAEAPVGDAFPPLDERAREAWTRILGIAIDESKAALDTLYADSLISLADLHAFQEILPLRSEDPAEFLRRWRALSPAAREQFNYHMNHPGTSAAPRDEPPPEEPF